MTTRDYRHHFSPREVEILEHIRSGKLLKQVGYKGILHAVHEREGFTNSTHAVAVYVEWRCLLSQSPQVRD